MFSPDGDAIAALEAGMVVLWDLVTGEPIGLLDEYRGQMHAFDVSSDGKFLVSLHRGGYIWPWDTITGLNKNGFNVEEGGIASISISPDDSLLAVSGGDVRLWSINRLELKQAFATNCWATDLDFNPDGDILVAGDICGWLHIWDTNEGRLINDFFAHKKGTGMGGISSVDFSGDGRFFASGGAIDKTVQIRSAANGNLFRALSGHEGNVTDVEFSPNGSFVASGGGHRDGSVRVWDTQTGNLIHVLDAQGWAKSLAFSLDGSILVSSGNGTRFWDVETGEQLHNLPRGWGNIAFSSDGRLLYLMSQEGVIRIWGIP